MTAIVRLALSRPYTFVVMAILILIFGALSAIRTPTDIFPNIGIPVISVVWSYTGLPPDDMSNRILSGYERALSTTVNDIEHIESTSLPGLGIVKVYFQPNVDISAAQAQVTSISQTVLKQMPPGVTPPIILVYNASSVPIIQLALSSDSLSQTELNDLAQNFIRPQLTTVAGAQLPYPYGGSTRQVQIDLDQHALHAHNLSANDVGNALARQNLITPAGTEKIGSYEYTVDLNNSPKVLSDFNNLPVKVVDGVVVFMRDIGYVHDGSPPQTNVVQLDGRKGVLMSVLKIGAASTLDIISGIKERLPAIQATLPPGVTLKYVADQSGFVKSSVAAVVREGLIAAALTGFMILVFLGSWRSTLIITVSIPLAVLSLADRAFGARPDDQRDDARRSGAGGRHPRRRRHGDDRKHQSPYGGTWRGHSDRHHARSAGNHAAGDGRAVLHLHRLRAVALARRSRRLPVPAARDGGGVRDDRFLPAHLHSGADDGAFSVAQPAPSFRSCGIREPPRVGVFGRFQRGFEHHFERLRQGYLGVLQLALGHRFVFAGGFLCVALLSLGLAPYLGEDFFPSVDAGAIRLHMRAPTGTRIEETTRLADEVEQKVRTIIPPDRIASVVDNIGLPISGINNSYGNSGTIGVFDADMLISLNEGPTSAEAFVKTLREQLPTAFPGVDVLLPTRRYREPDPEFRIAGAARRSDRGRRSASQPGLRRTICSPRYDAFRASLIPAFRSSSSIRA